MDSEAHVYLLDGRDENIGLTVRFLIDYLPSSFPIIAHLATPPLGKTRIFTSLHPSFLLENVDSCSRRLFSIGIYVEEKEGDEFPYRYYCSAEAEAPSSDGTQKELIDGHVRDFINTWFLHLELPAKGQLRIGSLNIRWLKALRSRIIYADPCAKYIRPPTPRQDTNISTSPPSWEISQLLVSEIPRAIETSHITRSLTYVQSRLPYSRCIRLNGEAAAWGLIHKDGSVGCIYVEEKFRRMGLAHQVVRKLVDIDLFKNNMEDAQEMQKAETRWNMSDVVEGNLKGNGLFESRALREDGWRYGWECAWTVLSKPEIREEIPK